MLQGRRDGELFSGGWQRGKAPPEAQHGAFQRFSQLAYLLVTLSKPTIAWLNGEVRGSGLGLALARCRVATKSSSFRVDAVQKGWALDGGLSFALPRLRAAQGGEPGGKAALAMARYLALTGAPLSGGDMLACGMATHVMDDAMAALIHKRCGL
jgi:enoyl-CoA hydratase/carnithine racemase